MTMSATYGTFLGQVVHEVRSGVERVYVPDTLGSTHKLTDGSGNVTDSFDYWPYGEERVRTGTTATPFTFVGTLGYYKDAAGRMYVRARTYLARYARWLTVDPLWPQESAYGYVKGNPDDTIDPLGMAPTPTGCGSQAAFVSLMANALCQALKDPAFSACVKGCAAQNFGNPNADPTACMAEWCQSGSLRCSSSPSDCGTKYCASAPYGVGGARCDIAICPTTFSSGSGCGGSVGGPMGWFGLLSHELGHCCNQGDTSDPGGYQGPGTTPLGNCNYRYGFCVGQTCHLPYIASSNGVSLASLPRFVW